MTVLEALNVEVNNETLSEKWLIHIGMSANALYDLNTSDSVELAKAYCFRSILTQSDFGEDGLSVKYDRSYVRSESDRIFKKNDLEDMLSTNTPEINDKSGLW